MNWRMMELINRRRIKIRQPAIFIEILNVGEMSAADPVPGIERYGPGVILTLEDRRAETVNHP